MERCRATIRWQAASPGDSLPLPIMCMDATSFGALATTAMSTVLMKLIHLGEGLEGNGCKAANGALSVVGLAENQTSSVIMENRIKSKTTPTH